MKTCRLCKRDLPLESYSDNIGSKDKKHSTCKECRVVLEAVRRHGSITAYYNWMRLKLASLEGDVETMGGKGDRLKKSIRHIETLMNEEA